MNWSGPVFWMVAGLVLFALEAYSFTLFFLFFGFGAVLTSLLTWLFAVPTEWQFIFFCAASLISLASLRGSLKKITMERSSKADEGMRRMDSFLNEIALVSEPIPANGFGRVKARGSFFNATAKVAIEAGQIVVIIEDTRPDHSLFTVEPKP